MSATCILLFTCLLDKLQADRYQEEHGLGQSSNNSNKHTSSSNKNRDDERRRRKEEERSTLIFDYALIKI